LLLRRVGACDADCGKFSGDTSKFKAEEFGDTSETDAFRFLLLLLGPSSRTNGELGDFGTLDLHLEAVRF